MKLALLLESDDPREDPKRRLRKLAAALKAKYGADNITAKYGALYIEVADPAWSIYAGVNSRDLRPMHANGKKRVAVADYDTAGWFVSGTKSDGVSLFSGGHREGVGPIISLSIADTLKSIDELILKHGIGSIGSTTATSLDIADMKGYADPDLANSIAHQAPSRLGNHQPERKLLLFGRPLLNIIHDLFPANSYLHNFEAKLCYMPGADSAFMKLEAFKEMGGYHRKIKPFKTVLPCYYVELLRTHKQRPCDESKFNDVWNRAESIKLANCDHNGSFLEFV